MYYREINAVDSGDTKKRSEFWNIAISTFLAQKFKNSEFGCLAEIRVETKLIEPYYS